MTVKANEAGKPVAADVELPTWQGEVTLADWNELVIALESEDDATAVMEFLHSKYPAGDRTAIKAAIVALAQNGFVVDVAIRIVELFKEHGDLTSVFSASAFLKQMIQERLIVPGKG